MVQVVIPRGWRTVRQHLHRCGQTKIEARLCAPPGREVRDDDDDDDDGVSMIMNAVNGESAFVNVETNGSGGGESASVGMTVTGGIEGKWLIFSLSGGNIQPGYYHFTTLLLTQGLSEIGCDEGSFRLTKGVISDPLVRTSSRWNMGGGVRQKPGRSQYD